MQKSFDAEPRAAAVTDELLGEINRFTRKPLTADEVYVFSVLLCDNEIDRDYERFSVESLRALAPMMVGRTALLNHSPDAEAQTARTFRCTVVTDETRRTSLGEPYTYLQALCYMPRIPENAARIAEIDAGIKKEASVGCAVRRAVCSICGADERTAPCAHRRGRVYGGKTCHYVLEEPTDAYEWSFVAVPAQRAAGVMKRFSDAVGALGEKDRGVRLSAKEARALSEEIAALRRRAEAGERYRDALEQKAVRGLLQALPALDAKTAKAVCAPLDTEALAALAGAVREKQGLVPQLLPQDKTDAAAHNARFKL